MAVLFMILGLSLIYFVMLKDGLWSPAITGKEHAASNPQSGESEEYLDGGKEPHVGADSGKARPMDSTAMRERKSARLAAEITLPGGRLSIKTQASTDTEGYMLDTGSLPLSCESDQWGLTPEGLPCVDVAPLDNSPTTSNGCTSMDISGFGRLEPEESHQLAMESGPSEIVHEESEVMTVMRSMATKKKMSLFLEGQGVKVQREDSEQSAGSLCTTESLGGHERCSKELTRGASGELSVRLLSSHRKRVSERVSGSSA